MSTSRTPHQSNYLDCVPNRAVQHELDENGRVILLRPKWVKGLLAKYLQPRLSRPFFRVKLDLIGAAIWNAIDGVRTIHELADLLYEEFGDEIEPRYERCARFIHSLQEGAMIRVSRPNAAGEE